MLSTFTVTLPSSAKDVGCILWKHPHRYALRCAAMVLLHRARLPIKIGHLKAHDSVSHICCFRSLLKLPSFSRPLVSHFCIRLRSPMSLSRLAWIMNRAGQCTIQFDVFDKEMPPSSFKISQQKCHHYCHVLKNQVPTNSGRPHIQPCPM